MNRNILVNRKEKSTVDRVIIAGFMGIAIWRGVEAYSADQDYLQANQSIATATREGLMPSQVIVDEAEHQEKERNGDLRSMGATLLAAVMYNGVANTFKPFKRYTPLPVHSEPYSLSLNGS